MLRDAARRLLWSIPIILAPSVVVFFAVQNTTDPGALRAPRTACRPARGGQPARPDGSSIHTWLGTSCAATSGVPYDQPPGVARPQAAIGHEPLGSFAFLTASASVSPSGLSGGAPYSGSTARTPSRPSWGCRSHHFSSASLQIVGAAVLKMVRRHPVLHVAHELPVPGRFGYDRPQHMILPALRSPCRRRDLHRTCGPMLEVLNSDYCAPPGPRA